MPSFSPSRAAIPIVMLLLSVSMWAVVGCVGSWADDFKQPDPLEPEVAAASSEAAESMAGIRIPEGWKIELFAAEPDVANIVAMDIDYRGRVFVCETFRQNRGVTDNRGHDQRWLLADLASETVQDRIDYHKRLLGEAAITYAQHDDRIRRLDDTDADGVADQSYVLAKGFNRIENGTGAGVLVRGSTVYYTNIPQLWKLIDEDDDGHAEQRIVLSDGYGVRVAFRGHDMHGLVIGPDGRLYFSIGDRGYHVTTTDGRLLANPESGAVFRCELDGSGLEVFASGLRNPQELAFNDLGDFFSVDNNSDSGDKARIVHLLEGGDSGWRMHYQYLADRGPFNREKIWEPHHPQQPAYIVPPVANFTDGPSGLAYYPGTGFGESLNNTFLICDFRGGPANSGIRSFQLEGDGAFYRLGETSDPIWTVLATDVLFGPDGAIYVSDWVDGWNGMGKGRIYRLTDPAHSETTLVKQAAQLLAGDWTQRSNESLAGDLAHPDRRIRLEAQWQLAAREESDTLGQVIDDAGAPAIKRLHAIWGVDQIARKNPSKHDEVNALIRPLLVDSEASLRAAAAKVAGERGDLEAVGGLRKMLSDDDARVRYFATMSLGKLKDAPSMAAVVKMLATNNNADPALRHAGVMYLSAAADSQKVADLKSHKSVAVRRSAVVALRRKRDGKVESFLADPSPLVVLAAARAIHDQPIPVSMEKLANLIEGELKDPELIRRVLNANDRLGNSVAADRLAEFAAHSPSSTEMRIEALDMLAKWSKPGVKDRVLGSYRPTEPRPIKVAADALSTRVDALMTANDLVREKAIEVSATLGLKKIVPLLIQRAADTDRSPAVRANALRSLARLDQKQALKIAKQVKMLPATELLPAALEVLAAIDATASLGTFITATESRVMGIRQLGWDLLAKLDAPKSTAAIVAGVQKYLDGTLPQDVHLNVLEAAQGRIGAELTAAITEHDRAIAAADPLGPWLVSLHGGDPGNGSKLFFEKTEVSCLRCHQVDRAGGEVGPKLSTIGKQRDRRYLLESICLPNSQIAKGFETAVIANDLGQVFTGIVKTENDDYVELILSNGSQERIYIDDIEARRKGNSSMPDDLVKLMSRRELRDMVAYLASLQIDPRAAEAVE